MKEFFGDDVENTYCYKMRPNVWPQIHTNQWGFVVWLQIRSRQAWPSENGRRHIFTANSMCLAWRQTYSWPGDCRVFGFIRTLREDNFPLKRYVCGDRHVAIWHLALGTTTETELETSSAHFLPKPCWYFPLPDVNKFWELLTNDHSLQLSSLEPGQSLYHRNE